MLVISESINLPVLQEEDRLWVDKNGVPYGTDAKGKEFEITPSIIQKYYNTYGGQWIAPAKTFGGAALGGVLSVPVAAGIYNTFPHGFGNDLARGASMGGLIGTGAGLGLRHEMNRVYNDIIRKRQAGEL